MNSIFLPSIALMASAASPVGDLPHDSPSAPPEKVSFLVTFGEEQCPEASEPDEIVVCATAPEGDRYRIPKDLRKGESEPSANQSWTSAVESLDNQARPMRPNSCSAVGSGGFTGCTQAMLREWFAARRGQSRAN